MIENVSWQPDLTDAEFQQMVIDGPQPQDCIGPYPTGLTRYHQPGLQDGAWYIDNRGAIYVYIPWRRIPWQETRGPLYAFFEAHDTHLKVVQGLCPEHRSILDIGGYDGSWAWLFDAQRKVVLDTCQEALERWAIIHADTVCASGEETGELFGDDEFDVVFLLDVIEHLKKEDGLVCLGAAEQIAKNQVIVVVPDGWLAFDETNDAWIAMSDVPCLEGMKHRSAWDKEFFENRGYHIITQPDQHVPIGGGDALVCFYNKEK